ncbi:MAG: DUF192 domain-containing protein [Dehalococcoidia bacterium]|nr:DUF192 domain-containing protein [Dehalococcoidia bacterium]
MRVKDETAGVELGHAIAMADNPWTRFRGLMLRGTLAPGEGLRIEPCASIHMMFMRFAIDAVFYDREGRVTAVASRVRPWLGIAGKRGSRGVIELPAGAAAAVKAGDQLVFEE